MANRVCRFEPRRGSRCLTSQRIQQFVQNHLQRFWIFSERTPHAFPVNRQFANQPRAFNIGLSYVVGGLVPLSPYFFVTDGLTGLKISAAITLCCLFIFGYFKSKLTGVHPLAGAARVMVIGALAAGCAFAVARLIQL